ncbi:ABC-type nitrate/sulfonate/bicarbonate transport system ATPase subunit/ABC-type nitrate/sulfonate/bicarbonate transport system permease component [Bradyrhizobium ottawaense]|uniref:ABC-type nitrate/sulfonate/bicarbonate transport system ATPase subunit/ABC-type nitrate/sulfonate/bicarbonate transport system permease component n=2 Tax=Bradyrhizobium ottawaense TaxID=931866 RepID=A0ABV4FY19_9BRAD
MNLLLQIWGDYTRLTRRWPGVAAIIPFIPVLALWTAVSEAGVFPRAFFPGPADVLRAFFTLTYKGILPDYLQDSLIRLATGAAVGMALGIPLGILIGTSRWAHRICWPVLLFFQAIGDIAWLPILLIWFGFGLTTMTFVIVYTVLFPVVLNTVLGVESVPRDLARAALSLGASRARVLWEVTLPGALPNIITGLRNGLGYGLARADRGRDDRRHIGHRLHDVRCPPRRLYRGDSARHDHSRIALVHRGRLGPRAARARDRPTLGIGDIMKTLSLRNLGKTYFDPYAGAHVTAVHDVSLDVEPGEFISVVGPSGCGKTTILNMIAGFIPYSKGDILLDGKPVHGPGPERGVVFQSFALFPWKTVLDNVGFGPKMRGVPKAERDRIAREYLALAGLSHAAHRYPNELSGGMQQRVGVVRALANNPDVLLMDEPFASVDAQTRMTLQEELTRIWQERKPTVIFITHDVPEAVFLANRVVVLSKGRVLDEIAVDLPRPRVWDDLVKDDHFKQLSARVLQMVRAA